MKKTFRFLSVVALAMTTVLACNKADKEVGIYETTDAEEIVLTFSSEKPDLLDESLTKTAWDASDKCIYWTSTDKIRVAIKVGNNWQNADGDATDEKGPKLYESNAAGSDAQLIDFKVPTLFKTTTTGDYKFYGIYPSSVTSTDASYTYMPSINVTLPTMQTPGAGTFDPAGDIMVAESNGELIAIPEDKVISLNWTRVVAHGDITLKKLPTFEEGEVIRSITITAQDGADLTGAHYLNLITGEFSLRSGATPVNYVTLNAKDDNLAKNVDGNIEFWFTSLPFTATSLKATITTNKYIYTKEYTGISKEFKGNARNMLGISMNNCSKADAPEEQLIADGYYVISYDDYMMTVGTESESYRGSAEKNVTSPTEEAIWRIKYVAASDAYTILSLGAQKELRGVTADNTTLSLGGNNGTNLFTIEKSSSEATTYKIAPAGNTSRSIGYNSSANPTRFALYKNTGSQPITLNLTAVTVNETPEITIADEEKTKTVAAPTTSVSFAYTANIFATEAPTVDVASDPDGIVNGTPTVADGTITVKLNANTENKAKTATLTVSGSGIATPITLTINQEAKLGDVFTYSFTSKDWKATRGEETEDWTNGKSGSQVESARGVQVQTSATGANAESPFSFNNITKVTITLAKSSSGKGSVAVKVGNTTIGTQTSFNTTATEYSFDVNNLNGKVSFVVTCSTNSLYVKEVSITAASINLPTAYAITCATGLDNGSVEADKETAYEGATVNLTAKPDDGYKLGDWNVYKTGDETTKVTVSGNSFEMPAYPVTVSASFVVDDGGSPDPVDVTLQYTGSSTGNFADNTNEAAKVGLSSSEWSVIGSKGSASNNVGYNKDGDIRLYYNASGSNTLTVSSLTNATINYITIEYTSDSYNNGKVLVDGNVVTANSGKYTINSDSFAITNGNTSNTQVRIKNIVINYTPSN